MDVSELLADLFGRVEEHVHTAVDELTAEQLTMTVAPGSNPIAWLVWHLARVEDEHIAELLDEPQLWEGGDWAGRFGLAPDPDDTGYAHSAEQVAAVRPDGPGALVEYYDAVAARTRPYLEGLTPHDLDRVVDERWDPPVTLGVRLVSIVDDEIQHGGQAAYLRGLIELSAT